MNSGVKRISRPFGASTTLPLLSGLLLGISFPTYPWIRLELLAWVALVPLLHSLSSLRRSREAFRQAWLAMALFSLISLWWVGLATPPGGALTVLAQSLFLTVPFMLFHLLSRRLGKGMALAAYPFLQVGWEWLYMQQELSLGWLTLGNSQASLIWMIQYADHTGVWGVSFWLAAFNALLLAAWMSQGARRVVAVSALGAMVLLPLLYAAALLPKGAAAAKTGTVRVGLVQPAIDPWEKWSRYSSSDIMERYYRLTGDAILKGRPELVIWPETALPFHILEPSYAGHLESLRLSLRAWESSLITGFSDIAWMGAGADTQPLAGAKLDEATGRRYQAYNASMLLPLQGGAPQVYRKVQLVPFAERVPYADRIPWLENLTVSLAGIGSWGQGDGARVMRLQTREGREVVTATIICYESIFPGFVTGFVRQGAEFLTLVTNDGWYGTSYGPYQHLAIGRFRCIENRRAMARCANTGLSAFIDPYGRTIAEVPWWEEQTLLGDLPLQQERTFYTRHPDLLPKGALLITAGFFLLVVLVRKPGA